MKSYPGSCPCGAVTFEVQQQALPGPNACHCTQLADGLAEKPETRS